MNAVDKETVTSIRYTSGDILILADVLVSAE